MSFRSADCNGVFLGVYLTICVTYGVVRGVTAPALAKPVEPTEAPVPQTTAEIVSAPVPEIAIEQELMPLSAVSPDAAFNGRGRGRNNMHGTASGELIEIPVQPAAPISALASEAEVKAAEEGEDEKQTEDASEPAAIPTLEEYLKNLHCGGCGRNCFLINPRCMRGARKESQAESAYFEQYGENYADGI